jgi:RNA polymerase sigma factor (sigma-70 family)
MHPNGHFRTTHWSLVLAAGAEATTSSRRALETLCGLYWYPLYAFVRRRGCDVEEARDLTQGFFTRLIEKNVVRTADPGRGKFRSYLLGTLKHYLANEWDRARALKRGGGRAVLSIDTDSAESRFRHEPADEMTPQKLFERQWALTLLDAVLKRLREEFAQKGREHVFERLKVYLSGETGGVGYDQVASELDMTKTAVKVTVHRLRRRYQQLLRDEIAQTVASEEEVEEEIQYLFAAFGE